MTKMITISLDRYKDLMGCEEELLGLKDAGVDNWDGSYYIYDYIDEPIVDMKMCHFVESHCQQLKITEV